MENQQNIQKNLRSREPQVNARPGAKPSLHSHSTPKIKVGNKIVGVVVGDIFVKRLHSKTHFLRKPKAIAFDIDTLIQAQELGASLVRIIDLDTDLVYIVSIELIYEKGFYFNRGFGDQLGLTLNYWQVEGPEGPQLHLWRQK